jgi:hypothetical protein
MEVDILKSVRHPSIIFLKDVYETEDKLYIVTEVSLSLSHTHILLSCFFESLSLSLSLSLSSPFPHSLTYISAGLWGRVAGSGRGEEDVQ